MLHAEVMEGPSEASLLPLVAFPMFVGGGGGDASSSATLDGAEGDASRLAARLTPDRNSCAHDNTVSFFFPDITLRVDRVRIRHRTRYCAPKNTQKKKQRTTSSMTPVHHR